MSSIIEQQDPTDRINEIEVLRSEKRRISAAIMHSKEARNELYSVNKYGIRFAPLYSFVTLWIIDLVFALLLVFYVLSGPGVVLTLVLFLSIMVIGVAVINLVVVFPKVKKKRKIDADITELYAEARKVDERIKALEND